LPCIKKTGIGLKILLNKYYLIKKAFKSVYLRPERALRILKSLSLNDIYYLAKYAKISSSM